MALPSNIGYCAITGHFIRAVLDGSDPGNEPDGVPVAGLQISIKADVAKPSLRHAASKTTILLDTIDVTTNANGDLIGKDLVEGIKVIAGDNPSLGIFTYTATISGPTYPRQTLTFDAPTGGTRDLSDLVEVPPAPGATLNAWLEAKNSTLAARDEVLLALENGSGTGGAVASVNGKTGAITLSAADVGAQPVGSYATTSALSSYATTSALTSGLAGKQASGDYATNTALTSGLSGKLATSLVPANLGPSQTADKLVTLGTLATALGIWPIPIKYNTGSSTWPARSSVVPAWWTGPARWEALNTVDVANPSGLLTDDVVVDQYAA